MKILVLTPTFYPVMGGAEKGIYEIYRRIAADHDVTVLTPGLKEKIRTPFQAEERFSFPARMKVERFRDVFNMMEWPGQGRLRGGIPPFSLSAAIAALRAVKRIQPDAVNVFYALPCGLAAVLTDRLLRIPVLLSLVGRDIPGPQIPSGWAGYARKAAGRVSEVAFISRYCRKALFPQDPSPGLIVPFGADTDLFSPPRGDLRAGRNRIRERYGIPKDAVVLFSLQRLDSWKRVDIPIKAMSLIAAEKDAYLIVGGKGPESDRLRRLAGGLKLASRVIFAGYIPEADLPLHYQGADAFIFHSTYETFGVVIVQAMACGTPVVAVDTTAVPELVRHGKTGLCVEPMNPKALAEGVLETLNNPERAGKMAREAWTAARRHFSWDLIAERYRQILSGLRPGGGVRRPRADMRR